MSFFYSDSKTDLKLLGVYCIKFQLYEGAQNVFSRFTAVCFMLLPHNPYRVAQHYKRHVCPVSVNTDFCGYLRFLNISFFPKYVGTVRH